MLFNILPGTGQTPHSKYWLKRSIVLRLKTPVLIYRLIKVNGTVLKICGSKPRFLNGGNMFFKGTNVGSWWAKNILDITVDYGPLKLNPTQQHKKIIYI